MATLDAPPPRPQVVERSQTEQRVPPASPDDVARSPLPVHSPAPWDTGHVADGPQAPADAQGGDQLPAGGQSRDLYVVEPITEEPDWGQIGGQFAGEVPPDLGDSPFTEYVPQRPRPAAPPAPAAAEPSAPATAGRPADIRAHPMYEDIKSRFNGRVREIGKNRNVPAVTPESDVDDEDAEV
ncbi:hypothetical protein ACFSC4_14260 [Deinococcus malanensis]|uniref:hypothetical protein n=1 Tax=Deinococcus malanensis TaxID=1706855 RepID=UPI0036284309